MTLRVTQADFGAFLTALVGDGYLAFVLGKLVLAMAVGIGAYSGRGRRSDTFS
jgi:hypothetical protein